MRRIACTTALLATCIVAAPAAPAGAADVGPQVERRAPTKYPADIGGCGRQVRCLRGRTIHRGWVLLSRTVRLDAGESRIAVRFRCPGGRRFRTFGHLESADVAIEIARDQYPYTRRTRVRMFARRILAPRSQPSSGTVYAVCVPRNV